MAKKYTADTFEGAVTGTASGNVAKTGDTMTGDLEIQKSSPRLELDANGSGVPTLNLTAGGAFTPNASITFGSDAGGEASTTAFIKQTANPSLTELELRCGALSSGFTNSIKLRPSNTYFTDPLRIGADAAANELGDYEEGTYNFQFQLYKNNSTDGETIGSSGFAAFTNRSKYTKVGDIVTLFLDVEYQNGSSTRWTGAYFVGMTNLPFTPATVNTDVRHPAGGTYALRSYYQNVGTGHTIMPREGGYSNFAIYISLGGTLAGSYPGYGFEPIYASEMPQYRSYNLQGNVHLTGTVTYRTNQ